MPGGYAWLTTVALPTWSQDGTLSKACSVSALGALVLGVGLVSRSPRWSRYLGILGFLGFSLVTWTLLPEAFAWTEGERLRSAVGAVAWSLFAVGWGGLAGSSSSSGSRRRPEASEALEPRSTLPVRVRLALFVVGGGAAALPIVAWTVTASEDALLAHSLSAAGAFGVAGVGSKVVLGGGRHRGTSSRWWLIAWGAVALGLFFREVSWFGGLIS